MINIEEKKVLLLHKTSTPVSLKELVEARRARSVEAGLYWQSVIEEYEKYPIPGRGETYFVQGVAYPSVAHYQLKCGVDIIKACDEMDFSHHILRNIKKYFDKGFYYG